MKTALPPLRAAEPAAAAMPPAASVAERLAAFMRPGSLTLAALPPLSLYVHLPWCLKKCPYCDFNSHAVRGALEELPQRRYVDALVADLEAALPFVWGRRVHTIFIGGGTPSLFAPEEIERLLAAIRARLPLEPGCEITLEANPGTFERERFHAFRAAGVNRLSIGVQSFDDARLAALGRVHDAAQARAAVAEAKDAFETFNIDLMYALPGQTLAECEADLGAALAFAPPHLSVYQLTIEPNTYFAKYPPPLPDDDLASAMLDRITETTAAAGLERYEVSAYARPGHRCPPQPQLLGVRRLPRHRRRRPRQAQLPAPGGAPGAAARSGGLPGRRRGRAGDRLGERGRARRAAVRVHAQCPAPARRLRAGALRRAHRAAALGRSPGRCEEAERRGLVERDLHHVRPTGRGFDFLNDLLELFLPAPSR